MPLLDRKGAQEAAAAEEFLARARNGMAQDEEVGRRIERYASHPRWQVRNVAVKLAGLLGDPDRAEWLMGILRDRRERGFLRRNAATSLGRLGRTDPGILRGLIEALDDPYYEIRTQAALALGELAPHGSEAIEQALVHTLQRRGRERIFEVRAALLHALGRIGTRPASVIAVRQGLEDSNWKVRREAVQAMVRLAERGVLSREEALRSIRHTDLTSVGYRPEFPLRRACRDALARLDSAMEGAEEG